MRIKFTFFILIIVAPWTVSASEVPSVGSYGFNWLKPETAKCQKITEDCLKEFKTCRKNTKTGGFGEHKPTHVCQAAEGEWIIYANKAQCQDEFETMQANAP